MAKHPFKPTQSSTPTHVQTQANRIKSYKPINKKRKDK